MLRRGRDGGGEIMAVTRESPLTVPKIGRPVKGHAAHARVEGSVILAALIHSSVAQGSGELVAYRPLIVSMHYIGKPSEM